MSSLKPALFDITSPAAWGVKAHGAELLISPPAWPHEDHIVIDVENNQDGSCAGIGLTGDGRTILFYAPDVVSQWDRNVFVHNKLIGHNAKYDIQMLRKWGFNVSPDQIVWDTQLAEYVKDSTRRRYGLKALAQERFGVTYPDFKSLTGTGKKAISIGQLPVDIVANYNGCDVLFTYRLMQEQHATMTDEQTAYMHQIEMPTMRALLEMEERGVQIDADYIRSLDAGFGAGIVGVAASIRNIAQAEVNLNSYRQVGQLILDKAGLRLKSTAAEELRKHARIPLIKDVLRYRELNKLKSTYTAVLAEASGGAATYRLHARFNQTSTQTGRLSSSEPNTQNIPTRTEEGDQIRQGFIAKPGHVLIDRDYSQIEPRLMAHLSKDPVFIKIFHDGKSIYDAVAEVLGLVEKYKGDKSEAKRVAKIMWLALAYNAGAFKLSQAAGISKYAADRFINKMKQVFAQFFYWREKVIAQAEIDGGVTTLLGRFIPLGTIQQRVRVPGQSIFNREDAVYENCDISYLGPNYMIQGSAAEIMKLAIAVTREFSPILTCHDELLFEVPKEQAAEVETRTKALMQSVVELAVPLVVEGGTANSWSEAKH